MAGTIKSLAIRTKKSLVGLYAVGRVEDQASPLPETPKKYANTTMALACTPEGGSPKLDENLSPISMSSSATDSPSKRVLRRSLRKMRSSFDVLRGKPADEALSQVVRTPPSKPRPSLCLNFEASPPDQPMFNPERFSVNSSRADIHHSSPITVPSSKKSPPMYQSPFPMGTIPDTPGPIKKAAEEAVSPCAMRLNDMPMSSPSTHGPLPTPMPGTNLSFEDIQMEPPAIIVSSPSIPCMNGDDYFAIPTARTQTVVYNVAPRGPVQPLGEEPLPAPAPPYSLAKPSKQVHVTSQNDTLEVPKADADTDSYALDEEARKSLERNVTAYLGFHDALPPSESPNDLVRRRSTWGRHTGLYDGTGYASECVDDDTVDRTTSPKANTPEPPTKVTAPHPTPVEEVAQCPVSPSRMTGGPGPVISSSEASLPSVPRRTSASSAHAHSSIVEQEDKEALQDIIRAYSVYHNSEREDPGHDEGTSQKNQERYQNGCNRREIDVSARSTSTTLVGSN